MFNSDLSRIGYNNLLLHNLLPIAVSHLFRIDNNELYAKYVGQRKNGKPDGHGKGIAHDGGVYEGEWKDGVYDGQGTYILPGGEKYEGEWKDGLKHGHGILTYSNGEMLVGDFVMDHPFIFSSLDKDEDRTIND